jgi:Tol biopolymer transport system component
MRKWHIVILFSITLAVATCDRQPVEISPVSPLSPIETPRPIEVTATLTPTSTPTALPLPTWTKQPTLTPRPTLTPEPTLVPTLSAADLSDEAIAHMAVWRRVENDTAYPLYQISHTPIGVISLDWSPNARSLWLNIATGPGQMGNIARAASLVVNRDRPNAFAAGRWGDYADCATAHDWSPDGKQLAYVRDDGRLWLANPDGQNARSIPLPAGAEGFSSPLYSSDGQLIAVLGYHSDGHTAFYDLWVIDLATGEAQRVVEDAGYSRFAWSPLDHTLTALSEYMASAAYPIGAARLWIVNADSGQTVFADLASLPGTEGCLQPPRWVLNGQKVLATILLTPGVWLVDREGNIERFDEQYASRLRNRTAGRAAPLLGGTCDEAVASPDGSYVAYATNRTRASPLRVIDLRTGHAIDVGQGGQCYELIRLAWSPVSPHIARVGSGGLEVVNVAEDTRQVIAPRGLAPAWSPDGKRIAYWQRDADGFALYLFNLDDQQSMRLTAPSVKDAQHWDTGYAPYYYDITPHWLPDSTAIAFVSWRGELPEAYMLQLADK